MPVDVGSDFDPLTVPAVMPKSVRRVAEDGTPTQATLDWEQDIQSWTRANVANTNTRLTLVSSELDGAYAAVNAEATTRATADSALSSQITTVTARFGQTSAIGGLFIASTATGGANGQVRIALQGKATTAGTTYSAGIYLYVDTAGNRAVEIDTSVFNLTDTVRSLSAPITLVDIGGLTYINIDRLRVGTLNINTDALNDRWVQSGTSTSSAQFAVGGATNTITVYSQSVTATAQDQEIAIYGELAMKIDVSAASPGSTMALELVRTISGTDLIIDSRTYTSAGSAVQNVNYSLSRLDYLDNGVSATYSLRIYLVGVAPSGITMTYSTRKLVVSRRKR